MMWKWLGFVLLVCGNVLPLTADEVTIVVNETAGLHRGNFPAGIEFNWFEPIKAETQFVLKHKDSVVPAQFLAAETGSTIRRFSVDFRVTLAPHASAEYTVHLADGDSNPVLLKGFDVSQSASGIRLTNAPHLFWELDPHLDGILKRFEFGEFKFWDASQSELVLKLSNGKEVPVTGNPKGDLKVLKQGPWTTKLNYSLNAVDLGLSNVHNNVTLSFNVSRSWVQVDWQIYDPACEVKSLAVPMKLKLAQPTREAPTLIDFGTTTQVYSRLSEGQFAELRGNWFQVVKEDQYIWELFQGKGNSVRRLAVGPQQPGSRFMAEGWAHIMDSQKCLALAVDKFGDSSNDLIRLQSDGAVTLERTYPQRELLGSSKTMHLRFWLHFVFNPPHISAATSPQSMKTPLSVHLK